MNKRSVVAAVVLMAVVVSVGRALRVRAAGRPRPLLETGNGDGYADLVIACHGVEVVLAHLRSGSVAVAEGERVTVGDVLGRVGNSGNTTQPHLHIHAERGGLPGEILDGQGVPITFGGRFLVRNALFTGR
jgi:hypothetical protein